MKIRNPRDGGPKEARSANEGRKARGEGRGNQLCVSGLRLSTFGFRTSIWLPDMDLNHDKQIQSLLCYRYTIGQVRAPKVRPASGESIHCNNRGNETSRRFNALTSLTF